MERNAFTDALVTYRGRNILQRAEMKGYQWHETFRHLKNGLNDFEAGDKNPKLSFYSTMAVSLFITIPKCKQSLPKLILQKFFNDRWLVQGDQNTILDYI